MKRAIGLLVMVVVLSFAAVACTQQPSNPFQGTTSATPVVQTQVVPQTVVVQPMEAPATRTSSPATGSSMPSGWLQVETKNTSGQTLSFNHDNDGDLHMVFLTWGTVTASGTNLGDKVIRVGQDPAGEKVTVNGGWAKYQWQGGSNPTKDQITQLVNWRMAQLGGNSTISWQSVTTTPYTPKHAAEPSDWTQSRDAKFTGDKILTIPVDPNQGEVAIAWFHARTGNQGDPGPCTMYAMTKSGDVTYQGGLRFWKLAAGGNFTSDQFKVLVTYWKGVLQEENRGTCPNYTVLFQDSGMAF